MGKGKSHQHRHIIPIKKIKKVVIYVHPFEDNFVFLSFYWSKTMETGKGKERKRNNVTMREKIVVQKLSKNGFMLINIFFYFFENSYKYLKFRF